MKRIGILGGTFDPVHIGHIQLAKAARDELRLDNVLLIPAADPPHKKFDNITPFRHRLQMLKIATENQNGLEVSTVEAELPTPSYSIDTVRYLQEETKTETEFFFIIGGDSFADLLTWKDYQDLLKSVSLVVAARRGYNIDHKLCEMAIRHGYRMDERRWRATERYKDIYFLKNIPLEISSTALRKKMKAGDGEITGLDEIVLQYIRDKGLYRVNP